MRRMRSLPHTSCLVHLTPTAVGDLMGVRHFSQALPLLPVDGGAVRAGRHVG